MHVRIIFTGLLALSFISAEQGIVILPAAEDHYPRIVQTKGTCTNMGEQSDKSGCTDGGTWELSPNRQELRLNVYDAKDLLLDKPLVRATGRTVVDGQLAQVPHSAAEAEDLSWIPGVGDVVMGGGPLRPSCKKDCQSCRVAARWDLWGWCRPVISSTFQ